MTDSTRVNTSVSLGRLPSVFTDGGQPRVSKVVTATNEVHHIRSGHSRSVSVITQEGMKVDETHLEDLGYKQELFRGFSPFSAFAFCFTSVSVVPSLSTGLFAAIGMGGPAEIIWAWLAVSALTIVSGLAMAELASAYPQSGSVYYWSGQLAPPGIAPVFAYVAGWCNAFGNLAGDAAFAVGVSTTVAYCVQIMQPDNPMATWHQVLISLSVHIVWCMLNTLRSDCLGKFNDVGTLVQMAGTVIILGVLLGMSQERATSSFVFTQGYDCTNYTLIPLNESEDGCTTTVSPYTMVLGMNIGTYAFVGYEAGSQIAEETQNAAVASPAGIIATVFCCFAFGTIYLFAFLFATPDLTQLADPFVDTFTTVAGTNGGLGMMIIICAMFFFAGIGGTGTSTRIIWALGRDGAVPFGEWASRVWGKNFIPLNALIVLFFIETVMLLLPLVSESALTTITGACCFGYTVSYAIPFFLRLTWGRSLFKPGPFSLGCASLPIHLVSFLFQTMASVVLVWPTVFPVTPQNMNWTVVVVGALLFVGVLYWVSFGRKVYKGPVRLDETLEKRKSQALTRQSTKEGELAARVSNKTTPRNTPREDDNPVKADDPQATRRTAV